MPLPEELLRDVMLLPDEERGALALRLLDSLSPTDTRGEDAWVAIIERRAQRAHTHHADSDTTVEHAVARIEHDLEL